MKKSKIKIFLSLIAAGVLVFSFSSCNTEQKPVDYADGKYTGRSSDFQEDESGNGAGYGEVEIEVKSNKITACSFKMYELDGTLKDENYGADLTKENRLKAQKAVQSADKYAALLVKAGNINDVDAISGATISCQEFTEAVNHALEKAEKSPSK